MKLVLAIIQDQEANDLISALTEKKFRVTKLASTGGFLKSGNTTLMVGAEEEQLDEVLDTVKTICKTREQTIIEAQSIPDITGFYPQEKVSLTLGGATVFILNVDKFMKC